MKLFSKKSTEENEPIKGGRNLIILGFGAAAIALISTAVSLKIYHDTGDVYLDRSRPGFISDDEKAEKSSEEAEVYFSDSGEISAKDIEQYTSRLLDLVKKVDARGDDFVTDSLSDEQLNISPEENSEEEAPSEDLTED